MTLRGKGRREFGTCGRGLSRIEEDDCNSNGERRENAEEWYAVPVDLEIVMLETGGAGRKEIFQTNENNVKTC